jgi:membrane-associated phospholipid phosphatase
MNQGPVFDAVEFPAEDWDQVDYAKIGRAPLKLPAGWIENIHLPKPPAAKYCEWECRAVMAAKGERAGRLADIRREATFGEMVESVGGVLGRGKIGVLALTMKLIQDALYDQEVGIFKLKAKFSRGRPHHCCTLDLDPVFKKGVHKEYPGHPAYPSGHSTQAHTVALLLAKFVPGQRQELLDAAYVVARNREIGGFHFSSDTIAGQLFAGQFVDLLDRLGVFDKLIADAAKQEWS